MSKRLVCFWVSIFMLLLALFSFLFFAKNQFCLIGGGGEICYRSGALFSRMKGAEIYSNFYSFVHGGAGREVVSLSDSIREHYGSSAYEKFRRSFGWIKKDSLKFVVLDGADGALLLESGGKRGVLYFDSDMEKVVLDFDTLPKFLPIDIGWVNGRYGGKVRSGYSFLSPGGECFYRKGAALYVSGSSSVNDLGVICKFDKYFLVDTGDKVSVYPSGADLNIPYVGTVDNTMEFFKYLVE